MEDKKNIEKGKNDGDVSPRSLQCLVVRFCNVVVESILLAGGSPSTAYKCATIFAEDFERRMQDGNMPYM